MMHNRRGELEHSRRDPRERDSSPAGMSRKRPSMLSEFQGKHVYSDRDRSRVYATDNTYTSSRSHDYYHGSSHRSKAHVTSSQGGGGGSSKYGGPSGSYHRQNYNDPRHHSYRHFTSRPNNDVSFSSDLEPQQHFSKRAKLHDSLRQDKMVDSTGKSFMNSSNASTPSGGSGSNSIVSVSLTAEPVSPQYGGLSQYISDIESDDDVDVVAQMDKQQQQKPLQQEQTPQQQVLLPQPLMPPLQPVEDKPIKMLMDEEIIEKKEQLPAPPVACKMTKEELLLLMERVDHDIAKVELQVNVLKKKEAELADAEVQLSNVLPPATPPPPAESHDAEKEKVVPAAAETLCNSPSPCSIPSPVQPSMVETILSENQRRVKAAAETLLTSLSCAAWMTKRLQQPLYWQPCEAPGYHERIERHKRLRPHLVQVIRKRKVDLYKREVKLCEHYDTLLSEWEKKVEKVEGNAKRKAKDVRNKEFFEKHFPEIKRHTLRLGPKGFSVVRSEAELNEILDELYEQEEALDRYQRAHAPIPPMILTPRDDHKFLNTNGLVRDPLLAHKEQRMSTTWTDEEKQTFCEKFAPYPKCFEKIAQFIPNKTTSDCIQFYYLSKKKENYKELVAKVKDQKRKAAIIARQQLAAESASPSSSCSYTSGHLHKLADEGKSKSKPRLLNETQAPSYTGWTADEIQKLREGLRLYGRAWGKIYRMVGPVKTATQCKSFFDDYRDDPYLQLHKALAEHNVIKNAQKAKRKAEARKQSVASMYEAEKKRRKQKEVVIQESSDDATDDIESDRDSIIESSVVSEEKTFSDTTTEAEMLSSHTDSESSTEEADEVIDHQATHAMQRTRPSRLPSVRTSEDNIDLLFSAAEALASVDSSNGIVGISTKVALHDHTYSKPTGSLTAEFQGTSGLSLIAAAAAVVSPTMSSSPTGKSPLLSPVKAPRGRPPSSTKRNSAVSTKLGPTFLSPAGPSMHISLTDTKSYRGRGRGTTVPLTKTISHASKNSGITTKLTIPANRVGKTSVMSPTAGPSKFPPFSTGSNKSSTVPHPITQQGSTLAAFEALVNVAAAAKPAELPPKSLNHSSSVSSSQSSKKDNFNVTDMVISSTGAASSHLNNSGISVPNLRLPTHAVSPKQTTLVMSTTNKPVRSLPLSSQKQCTTTMASHSPLEPSRNIYIGTSKPVSGKSDLPLRTLTVYAPMLAAQQSQSSPTSLVSSNNLVVKKPTTMTTATSGLQHTTTVTTATRLTCDVTTAPIDSRVVTSSSLTMVKPINKPSVLVKPTPKADPLVKGVDPAAATADNRKDQSVGKISHVVSTTKANPSETNKVSDNEPIVVDSPCVEPDEEKELPLRITLGQGNNSSSLVPISISRPPEGEVKMPPSKTVSDDLPSKLHTPLTKAAKKSQKIIKVDRDKQPKAKKTRTSDEFEPNKEQVDLSIATAVDGPASSDFLNALIPNLVNSSAFLNSLTSTTGGLPSRSNITHIIDRSHSNSPATELVNSATVEAEDHLVSAAHDISELSKLLEPVSSSDQSNLDQCKTLDVASAPADFCPDATALSLFSYIPDGSNSNTSEQQSSSTLLSASTVTTS